MRQHKSIDNKTKLSDDLVKFPTIAKENTIKYINAKLYGEDIKLTPVFVTEKEDQKFCSLQSRTIEELKKLIFKSIDCLNGEDAKLQSELFQKTVLKKKKEKYIEFLVSLNEHVDVTELLLVDEQLQDEEKLCEL